MEISEIKQRLSINTVLKHYHLQSDRNHRLRCPFHDDKTPSMQVYPKTGTWTCFSSNCSAGSGDQVDFIMKMDGISKHEAIMKAKELAGHSKYVATAPQSTKSPSKGSELSLERKSSILTDSFSFFVRSLSTKPKQAIDYLDSRSLDYKRLSIGYDAGTLHKRKDTTAKQKQEYLRVGLLKPDKFGRKDSYYTRFNGCVVFPLLDSSGQVVSLYGRHTEKAEHHYLEGDHKGLFPGYPPPETSRLILTEAIIDAATLQQFPEITNRYGILSLYGTNSFTGEHRKAITAQKNLKEVVLFFDGDAAGEEAVKSVAKELWHIDKDLTITTIDTPEAEDVNSLLQLHEPEIFIHLLDNRIPCQAEPESSSFSTELLPAGAPGSIENKKELGSTPDTATLESPPTTTTPKPSSHLQVNADYILYETEKLQITLWGGIEIHTVNRLRATLHIRLQGNEYASFRDTADMYSHSQNDRLVKQAAEKLEISSSIVGEAIAGLIKELERYRQRKVKRSARVSRQRSSKGKTGSSRVLCKRPPRL